jgi:hypothetical protein
MSGKAIGLAFDIKGLSPTEKLVLVAYADHADHEGHNIYPSIGLVADKTGLSERSVQRATKELAKKGILIPDGSGSKGQNKWRMDMNYEQRQSVTLTECHQGGDRVSPGGVTECPKRGDSVTPEPLINHQLKPPVEPLREIPPDFSDKDQYSKNIQLPEIMIYREITGRIPGMPQMSIIYRVIRENQFTKDHLLPFWEMWVTRGYKVSNLSWLTDWAVKGEIPTFGGAAAKESQQTSRKAESKYLSGGQYGG